MSNSEKPKTTTITLGKANETFPILDGTLGQPVINIQKLGSSLNAFTLDEGLRSTAFCKSHITYIDGDQGVLLYRGYPIDQLANQYDYLDICYLLLNGDLPTDPQKQQFVQSVQGHCNIDRSVGQLLQSFNRDSHPMPMLMSMVSALAALDDQPQSHQIDEYRKEATIKIIAKIPALAAMCYRHTSGKDFIKPDNSLSYSENFLHMMFADKTNSEPPHPTLARAIDRIFTLHADHEQNASTATVRLAGSTGANPCACIAAGIAALWGPRHGGANEAALRMLEQIGDESQIHKYLEKAKDPNDPFLLMGFGHRVYKNYDPRAKVMQTTCHDVLEATDSKNLPLFKLAVKLEQIASEDDYFVSRKLYPNIDFYSGITLNAMGIPSNMFTAIFALSRTVGWIANWLEMTGDPDQGLIRPRQLYIGHGEREVEDNS